MIELLRRFGGKYCRYMVIGPACKLIEVIFDLLTPLVIAQMIDRGIGAHDVNAVVRYGMVLAAMAVIGISFTLVCQRWQRSPRRAWVLTFAAHSTSTSTS